MISQELDSQEISAKTRPQTREIKLASWSPFWTRTWLDAANPSRNPATTRMAESVIAAKILAAVAPSNTAITDCRTLALKDERGLIIMSQTA